MRSERTRAENWQRRSRIIDYCVNVVDQSMDGKKQMITETSDPSLQRKIQGALFAEEVKVSLDAYADVKLADRLP
jgi:hypothetical protein